MISIGYSGTILTNQPIYKIITLLSVPIFSYLLVDSMEHTKNSNKYFIKMWFLALIVQILFTVGVDTYNLNGIFGMIIATLLINRLKAGEWYWVLSFMALAVVLPIEFGGITVALTTLFYGLKHRDEFRGFKNFYWIMNILIPLYSMRPTEVLAVGWFAFFLYKINPNRNYKPLNYKIGYILLGVSYLILCIIRIILLNNI